MSRDELLETVAARCREIGVAQDADTRATLAAQPPVDAASSPAGAAPRVAVRELPHISIDLARTLGGRAAASGSTPSVERDLEVTGTLGEGGMGRVLLARQHSLDRDVAVKTLHAGASATDRAALLSEGAIIGHLEHPSITPVHALGVDADGAPVLVMKRLEGVEWAELLKNADHEAWRGDGRELATAHLEILMQIANAVHFAHSRGVVHRDIKPTNVIIGRFGETYLCDWGLAVRVDRPSGEAPLCGTPAYMAPEMVVGGAIDPRTDVYMLGATLHQVLTGQSRNSGSSMREALLAAARVQPYAYPASVPRELAALANRATSADPAARPASALEFRQALADYLQHRSSIGLHESALARLASLRGLTESGAGLESADAQRSADALHAEIRFALAEALRQWPDNGEAKAALDELDRLLEARHARAAELERLAREMDPAVAGRQRALVFVAVALVGAGLSISAIVSERQETTESLLWQSFGPLAVIGGAIGVLRRQVLRTTFNRHVAAASLVIVASVSVSRMLGLLQGASAAHVLVRDLLLLAVGAAVMGALLLRWFAWAVPVMLGAAAFAALHPERAMLAFSLATGVSLVMGTLLAWHSQPRD